MEIDDSFTPNERLFRRVPPRFFVASPAKGDEVLLNDIAFPRFSVNREKYSKPEEVLQPDWPTWGIVSFRVADVPRMLAHPETGRVFTFRVEYAPEPTNKAHSEVRTYEGDALAVREPSKFIKVKFRALLREKAVLLRAATALPS